VKKMLKKKKVLILISITSDIGIELAKRYSKEGYIIIGTYRSEILLKEIKNLKNCYVFHCDLEKKESISRFIEDYKKLKYEWDVFISCPCNPLPVQPFFKCKFDEWSNSVHVNVIEQMRILHKIHSYRNKNRIVDVVFFAGGGVNNAVINFSAYTASKIMLIKMCEFLCAENNDINIFIVGPGWTNTKTHGLVLSNLNKTDKKYNEITDFLESGKGTSFDDIYNSIKWLCSQGKASVSGRNFSIVNDQWKGNLKETLKEELKKDKNMYKLRRFKNDFLINDKKE
jgi:short-subunit dehydrogenase